MPSVAESSGAPGQLAAGLAAGVETLSNQQTVTFTKYVRLVLPLDGFVFWVRADLLSKSALFNAAAFNVVPENQASKIITPAATVTVQGSLHYATQHDQREDETIDVNRVIFTALQPIDEFNQIGPNVIFIGKFNGVRFAFSRRESFYQQTDVNHYVGDAIYPALDSQIIDSVATLNARALIVSNSLPVWLALNQFMPMYPSFLVPSDIPPPYASIHIDNTEALASAPAFDSLMTHTQLAKERVKITMYGMNNQQALDFQDYVFQYSLNTDVLGVMNIPVIRDEKRAQAELNVIAMKKSFEIDISYYQTRINSIAREFISKAIVQYTVRPNSY